MPALLKSNTRVISIRLPSNEYVKFSVKNNDTIKDINNILLTDKFFKNINQIIR